MKDIRPALRSFLLGSGSISTAVGGSRIFSIKIPQGVTSDSIVYNRISGGGTYIMEGLSGFAIHRYQIDCWSVSADGATALANLVRDRLDGYRGPMGSGPTLVTVYGVFMIDQRDDYDDVTKLVRMGCDYDVSFLEL